MKRYRSLRVKASIALSLIAAIAVLPLLINGYLTRHDLIKGFYQKYQEDTLGSLQFFAVEALETGIMTTFTEQSQRLLARPEIMYIELRDSVGRTYAFPQTPLYNGDVVTKTLESKVADVDVTDLTMTLADNTPLSLGYLTVVYDPTEKNQQLQKMMIDMILLSLLVFSVGVFAYWLMDTAIIKRIRYLSTALARVQKGEPHQPLIAATDDEIGDLYRGLNDTARILQERHDAQIHHVEEQVGVIANSLHLEVNRLAKTEKLITNLIQPLEALFRLSIQLDKKNYQEQSVQHLIGLIQEILSLVDSIESSLKSEKSLDHFFAVEPLSNLLQLVEKVLQQSADSLNITMTLSQYSTKNVEAVYVGINRLAMLRILIYTMTLVKDSSQQQRVNAHCELQTQLTQQQANIRVVLSFAQHGLTKSEVDTLFSADHSDPLQQRLKRWCHIHGVHAAATLKTNGDLLFNYDISASISDETKQPAIALAPTTTLYVYGRPSFVEAIRHIASELGHHCHPMDTLTAIDQHPGLLFVDCRRPEDMDRYLSAKPIQKPSGMHFIGVLSAEAFTDYVTDFEKHKRSMGLDELLCGLPSQQEVAKLLLHYKTATDVNQLISTMMGKSS